MLSKNIAYIGKFDHLRLLAAVTILLFHARLIVSAHTPCRDLFSIPLIDQGHTAVPLFMILSGMIFGIIAGDREIITSRFYLNRVLRIYPLFIFIVTFAYFSSHDAPPDTAETNYLMALLPVANLYQNHYGDFGIQLWTIPVELQFYLLFPFLLICKRRYGSGYIYGLIGFLMLLLALQYYYRGTVYQMAYFSIFGNLGIFLIGMLFSDLYRKLPVDSRAWWHHPLALVAVFILINILIYVMFLNPSFYQNGHTPLSPSIFWIFWPDLQALFWGFLVLAYLKSSFELPLSAFFARLGSYSYSIYVWHFFVILLVLHSQFLCDTVVAHLTPYGFGAFVILPLTLGLSAISYEMIEKPFLQLRLRYFKE